MAGAAIATQGTGLVAAKGSGFIGGGQFGYNWQAVGIVYSVETDIQGLNWSRNSGSIAKVGFVRGAAAPITSTGTITSSESVTYLGTLRGRAGILATPNLLVYGTGGLAYGGVETKTSISETLGFLDTPGAFGTSGSATATRVGWIAGAGAEWLFWSHWSGKIEIDTMILAA